MPAEVYGEALCCMPEVGLRSSSNSQSSQQAHSNRLSLRRLDLDIREFDLLRVLGEGSLSTVLLVRRKATGTLHALKVIDKFYIKRHKMTDAVIRERHVMDSIDSEWAVRLQFTFQVCANCTQGRPQCRNAAYTARSAQSAMHASTRVQA